MNLKKIYEQLGIEANYQEEVSQLNHRIILIVDNFDSMISGSRAFYDRFYPTLIKEFALLIGESRIEGNGVMGSYYFPLKNFFKENINHFDMNIKKLTILLEASKKVFSGYEKLYNFILSESKRVIELSPIDIGYAFSGETIIKKGASELDETLVLENLTWLEKYPNVRLLFENSLKHYLSKNFSDSITNSYSSLEGIVKTFLENDKRLDNNETRKELIRQLGLEEDWGQLLFVYCKLAHEFSSRHGRKETGEQLQLSVELVEFYIYITGTFIRLISKVMENRKQV